MKDLNPIDIFNDFQSGKKDSSDTIESLLSVFKKSQDDILKIQVTEIIVKNFLIEAEDAIKWIIINEYSPDCLFELYQNLEMMAEKAVDLKQFMELTIGRDFIKKYDLISKEALILRLLGRKLCQLTYFSEGTEWNFFNIKTKKGKVIELEVDDVYNVSINSKFLSFFSSLKKLIIIDGNLSDYSIFKDLTYLRVSGTEDALIYDIDELNGLEKLVNLQELDLSINGISEIKKLDKLVHLKKLNLSRNCIKEIKNLEQLTQLETLNLETNCISEIKGLDKLENLKELDLSANKEISEIKGLEKLTKLEVLKLENDYLINEIKGLDTLVNLKKLNLAKDDFMIDKSGAELLYNFDSMVLKNLDIFAIDMNERDIYDKERQKKILDKIMQLEKYEDEKVQEELDKYRHYITEIKGLEKLKNLEELDLTGNQISEIKGLERLRNLRKLQLDDNQISEIKGLQNLKRLEFLGLSNNRFKPIAEFGSLNKEGYSVRNPQEYVRFCQEKNNFS